MLDFGATDGHSNDIHFSSRVSLDVMTSYTIAFQLYVRGTVVSNRHVVAKQNVGITTGWRLRTLNSSHHLQMLHSSNGVDSAFTLSVDTKYGVIVTWTGTTMSWFFDDVAKGTGAYSGAITTSTTAISIGNDPNLGNGGPYAIGQLMIWPNRVLTAAEQTQWLAGVNIPALEALGFWHRGILNPGIDEIGGVAGTASGSPVLFFFFFDAFFMETVLADYLQMATLRLLSRSRDREFYTIRAPWRFLTNEIVELMNISAPSHLPKAASTLVDVEDHMLMNGWQRSLGRLVGVRPLPLTHEAEFRFKAHEKFSATYFSTDQLTGITSSERQGLARMDLGATSSVERTTVALLPQENNFIQNLSLLPAANADGYAWMPVGAFEEKLNHLGFLSEEAATNKVIDSAFNNGLGDWTAVAGSGSVTAVQGTFHAFPQSISDTQIEIVGAASEVYVHPDIDIAVLLSDAFMRLSIIWSNGFGTFLDWLIQRDTDSWYWNDSTEAWQSGKVWNASTEVGHDPTNTVHLAVRTTSNPISVEQNENWKIQLGVDNVGFNRELYQVDLTPGKFLFSPIVTGAAAVTSVADTTSRVLDPGEARQQLYAGRYSITFKMLAIQDPSWMADDDEFAFYAIQYDDANENNVDLISYRKPSGGNAQFSAARYFNSGGSPSLDARAFIEIDIVPGTEYSVKVISTSDSDGELGLPARTLRIQVDGVNGTDAQASATQSTSEQYTKLWKGCAPSGFGILRAMNYLHHPRFWPIVLADEEVA